MSASKMIISDHTSGSIPGHSGSRSIHNGLRYYVVRPDNSMTPLVPADQLPFQLQGIPCKLNHQQISQGKMIWVANADEHAIRLLVQAPVQSSLTTQITPTSKFLAPDHIIRAEPSISMPIQKEDRKNEFQCRPNCSTVNQETLLATGCPKLPPIENRPKSLTESISDIYQKNAQRVGFSPPALPPSGIERDPSKKEFCTHWIKTGDCAFMAQGCRYKHEMPAINKLREIGFQSVPAWWRNKSALRRPTWMQRHMQGEKDADPSQTAAGPGCEAITALFARIQEGDPRGMSMEKSERLHAVPGKEHQGQAVPPKACRFPGRVPDLIHFESPAPPPSRCSSCGSETTISSSGLSCGTTCTKSSPRSELFGPPPSAEIPKVDLSALAGSPKPPLFGSALARKEHPALRRHALVSVSSEDSELCSKKLKNDNIHKIEKVAPPELPTRTGLAMSKHAVQVVDIASEPCKSAQAVSKEDTGPAQKQDTRRLRSDKERKKIQERMAACAAPYQTNVAAPVLF